MLRIALLISGRGSNLDAIVRRVHADPAVDAEIVGVVSNRPHAPGLEIARAAGITAAVVDHRAFDDRARFEAVLATTLEALDADLIACAGFMRILTPTFVARFDGRLLNVHPSLLPDFPGLDTHARALARGDAEAGATVHLVAAEVDAGPLLARVRVPVATGDTPETLAARVLDAEHRLYPAVLGWIAAGRLALAPEPTLDGAPLPPTGIDLELDGDRLDPCPDVCPLPSQS